MMTNDQQIQAIRDALEDLLVGGTNVADYIAACNPEAMTALLARLDAAEADAMRFYASKDDSARYLFLRHSDQWEFKCYPDSMVSTKWHSGHAPQEIDKAIDAARAKEVKP